MLRSMFLPFRRYADFKGRSGRAEYWLFALLNVAVYLACLAAMRAGGFVYDPLRAPLPTRIPIAADTYGPLVYAGAGALALYLLAALVPMAAVLVRRLHDRGVSGWFVLLFLALSYIPVIAVVVTAAMLIMLALPGTPAPNRYGPDPRAEAAAGPL